MDLGPIVAKLRHSICVTFVFLNWCFDLRMLHGADLFMFSLCLFAD